VDTFLDAVVRALEERDATIARLEEQVAAAARQTPAPPSDSASRGDQEPESVAEKAAGLLALAHRTAEGHVAAAKELAERTLAEARQQSSELTGVARAEAQKLVAEAELAARELRAEQDRMRDSAAALRATAEQARADLESYLAGALEWVQQRPVGESGGRLRSLPA
jgi:cell division septum initiation protein DivIVA